MLTDRLTSWMASQLGASLESQTIREIVIDLLTGGNYRSSTEEITKETILIHSAWLLELCRRYKAQHGDNWKRVMFDEAYEFPLSTKAGMLVNWLSAFGQKTRTNVNVYKEDLPEYFDEYLEMCQAVTESAPQDFPAIKAELLTSDENVLLSQDELLWIMAAAGAMTLTLRGSQKSLWGNRIERAFLRASLAILGLTEGEDFWLNVTAEDDSDLWREVDAEVRSNRGEGRAYRIPIEYGLIGEGNPEITSDKLGRVGQRGGLCIVDKLRPTSTAYKNAEAEGATLITLRDNETVLEQMYQFLKGLCGAELKEPPSGPEKIAEKVNSLPDHFFEL